MWQTIGKDGRITIRLPNDLLDKVKNESKISGRSISSIVRDLLQKRFEGEDESPTIVGIKYKRIKDRAFGEVVWQIGITEDGKEFKIGPFFQTDIYRLLEQLPQVLTIEELVLALKILLKSLKKAKRENEEVEKFWREIARRRKDLKSLLERTRKMLWPGEQDAFSPQDIEENEDL